MQTNKRNKISTPFAYLKKWESKNYWLIQSQKQEIPREQNIRDREISGWLGPTPATFLKLDICSSIFTLKFIEILQLFCRVAVKSCF